MTCIRASLFAAVVVARVACATECAASERDEPIRLAYVAHADCPSEEDMLRRISAYTTRWTRAAPSDDARGFVLRIDRHGKTFAGRFELTSRKSSGAGTIRRDVEGGNCDDVATGLAVAVAIAIDPLASPTPAPEPAVDTSPAPAPTPRSERDDERVALQPEAETRTPRPPATTAARKEPPAVAIGGRVEVNGALYGAVPVAAAYVEIAWPALLRLSWFAPAVRFGAKQSVPHTAELTTVDVSVLWSVAFVELCPVRLPLGERVIASTCLDAQVGVVSAEARDVQGGEVAYRAWFDYGAAGGLRWQVHSNVFVELVGGVTVPVTRDRFRVTPDGAAMVAPRVAGLGGVGGGWRF